MTKYIYYILAFFSFFLIWLSVYFIQRNISIFKFLSDFLSSNFLTFVPCKVRRTHIRLNKLETRAFYMHLYLSSRMARVFPVIRVSYWSRKTWKVLESYFDIFHFPGKRLRVRESPGNLLKSSNKVFRNYVVRNVCRPSGELFLKSWEWKGLSEMWSPVKVLEIWFWKRVRIL